MTAHDERAGRVISDFTSNAVMMDSEFAGSSLEGARAYARIAYMQLQGKVPGGKVPFHLIDVFKRPGRRIGQRKFNSTPTGNPRIAGIFHGVFALLGQVSGPSRLV